MYSYSFFRRYAFVYRITVDDLTERYVTLFVSLRCRLQEKHETSLFIHLLIKTSLFLNGNWEGHGWKKTLGQQQSITTDSKSCIPHKHTDLNNQNLKTNQEWN
jgi:hypothetical protein